MAKRRYSSRYRGRQGGSAVLKALIVLLVILLAAGVLFYFFLGNYIEYTDDGVRLVLPWNEKPVEEDPAPVVSEVIVEEPEETVELPPPEVPMRRLEAVEVSPEAVTAGTAAKKVAAAGGSALLVRVKNVEGYLAWDSQAELAVAAELTGSADFRQAIAALAETEDLYLVARMNGFQDLWMCVHDKTMALTTPAGKLWYDTYGMPWLSPANAEARQYMIQLCMELAEMGFDEIMLEYAAFPAKGKVSAITADANYPAEGRDEIVSQWIDELAAALEGTEVRLSVRVKAGEVTQVGGNSGWTAGSLAKADRVWLDSDTDLEGDLLALEEAGLDDAREHLVQIFSKVPEDCGDSWAVLS